MEELNYTSHLNLTAYIIPIRSGKIENLARIINSYLLNKLVLFNVINEDWSSIAATFFTFSSLKILVSLPIQQIILDDAIENVECHADTDEDETWEWWSKIRTFCEESTKLGVILGNDLENVN
jgi:hypothetical protein